jgi:hypothetical protein
MAAFRKVRPINPHESPMAAAFLKGLHRRVERDHAGQVTLPVGKVDVAEIAQVLHALDRVRDDEEIS